MDRRRIRRPQVLTELNSNDEVGHSVTGKKLVRPEGDRSKPRYLNLAYLTGTWGEVPPLIELVVGGNRLLRYEPQELPPIEHCGAVVELAGNPHRDADDNEGIEAHRCLSHPLKAVLGCLEQGGLQEQVLAGVGGDTELGGHDQLGAFVDSVGDCVNECAHIVANVRNLNGRSDCGNRNKPILHGDLLLTGFCHPLCIPFRIKQSSPLTRGVLKTSRL